MSKFCSHLGDKISDGAFRGIADTYLRFCKICGEPIIENVVHLAAYIKKPRKIVNGKVVPIYLSTFGKIDFILANARLLNSVFPLSRGRPVKRPDKSFELYFFLPKDWFDLPKLGDVEDWHDEADERVIPFERLSEGYGKGRMPGETYTRLVYWAKRFYQIFCFMMHCLISITNSVKSQDKQGREDIFIGAFLQASQFLEVMAKANLQLKTSEIKATYAAALVNVGMKYNEASRFCGVKYEVIKTWQSYLKAVLRKREQFKKLGAWPPIVGVKIIVKDGRVVKVEPSCLKDEKVPSWVKIKDGKIVFEK